MIVLDDSVMNVFSILVASPAVAVRFDLSLADSVTMITNPSLLPVVLSDVRVTLAFADALAES